MLLIRDVLDDEVVDREGHKVGKVDGIVVEWRADGPPRLLAVEVGPTVVAARISPRFGAWVAARLRRYDAARAQPARIPWAAVQDSGINVKVDLAAEETTALAWEDWLRQHIVERIPGAG